MPELRSRLVKWFLKLRLIAAFLLVYLSYNPFEVSYYHWAVKPWIQALLSHVGAQVPTPKKLLPKQKKQPKQQAPKTGPHSVKAFIGVLLLLGWFLFLRATREKIGLFGILLVIAFFGTLWWMLSDYLWDLPKLSSTAGQNILLLIISFILMIGVLLPDAQQRAANKEAKQRQKEEKKKAKEEKKKKKERAQEGDASPQETAASEQPQAVK